MELELAKLPKLSPEPPPEPPPFVITQGQVGGTYFNDFYENMYNKNINCEISKKKDYSKYNKIKNINNNLYDMIGLRGFYNMMHFWNISNILENSNEKDFILNKIKPFLKDENNHNIFVDLFKRDEESICCYSSNNLDLIKLDKLSYYFNELFDNNIDKIITFLILKYELKDYELKFTNNEHDLSFLVCDYKLNINSLNIPSDKIKKIEELILSIPELDEKDIEDYILNFKFTKLVLKFMINELNLIYKNKEYENFRSVFIKILNIFFYKYFKFYSNKLFKQNYNNFYEKYDENEMNGGSNLFKIPQPSYTSDKSNLNDHNIFINIFKNYFRLYNLTFKNYLWDKIILDFYIEIDKEFIYYNSDGKVLNNFIPQMIEKIDDESIFISLSKLEFNTINDTIEFNDILKFNDILNKTLYKIFEFFKEDCELFTHHINLLKYSRIKYNFSKFNKFIFINTLSKELKDINSIDIYTKKINILSSILQ